jgi:hypothetical protein
VAWLLAVTLVSVAALFALGIHLQPLNGDLTRVGFFAEKDFGWNEPQLEFARPLYTIGQYNRHHDVVVLGDSFSTGRPELQWQNYLSLATGWSVLTLDANKVKLDQVLSNPVFLKTPPKLLIFELVERDLPLVLKQNQTCDHIGSRSNPPIAAAAIPKHVFSTMPTWPDNIKRFSRPMKRATAWHDINVGYVRGYLWHSLLRQLFGDTHTRALKIALNRPAPFSSRNNRDLLVFRDDLKKARWWRDVPIGDTSCRIEAIRGKVEANRHTRFIFMAAPDKLTAYSDFITEKDLPDASALAELSSHHPSVMPHLDLTLKSALNQGVLDVYMPNDTHWGSIGNRITTETLITFLGGS